LKSEKGVTLVILAITIIVMTIITGVAVTVGTETLRSSYKTAFITELEMIQEKVNTIYEKQKLSDENLAYYSRKGRSLSEADQSTLNIVLEGMSQDGYRYFTSEDLEQLDLSNMSQDVIINFETRDVASLTGITIDGVIYYRLADIPEYTSQAIEYVDKNTKVPTFSVTKNKISDSWQIVISNIVYNSNVASGTLSYKLQDDTEWIIVGEKTYFYVTVPRNI
jgi:Tfp pilus assembly protein PilE